MVVEHMLPAMEVSTGFSGVADVVMQPATDAMLVARLVAGDDSALGLIYDRFGSLVFGLARSISHDEQISREVSQDVFTHLWEFPDRVDLSRNHSARVRLRPAS